MTHLFETLLAAACSTAPLLAQSEELYRIADPLPATSAWGQALKAAPDLDGDGVGELVVGTFGHGGAGTVATVHSGATGALLYTLAAPFLPLFFGEGLVPVDDHDGDGVPDLVVIGSHSGASGSPTGRFQIHSGADGSVLQVLTPPIGFDLVDHAQHVALALDDADGDGRDDVLAFSSFAPASGLTATLFSTASGQPIFSVVPAPGESVTADHLVRLSDHDGDGAADFAVVLRAPTGSSHIEVRSGATGTLIHVLPNLLPGLLTGNREPLIAVEDADGDGLRDLAVGGVFIDYVGVLSSASGSVLREWNCAAAPAPCVGSRLIEIADISGDGRADLLALESSFSATVLHLYALDPASGAVLFEEPFPSLSGGYSGSERIVALPGVDPLGFPTFAAFQDKDRLVSARRVAPEIGASLCPAAPNSTGVPATIHALGSASLAANTFALELRDAPPLKAALFVFGPGTTPLPFGGGTLCVGTAIKRLFAGRIDAAGRMRQDFDLATLGVSTSWTFQTVFRDQGGTGLRLSDATVVKTLP